MAKPTRRAPFGPDADDPNEAEAPARSGEPVTPGSEEGRATAWEAEGGATLPEESAPEASPEGERDVDYRDRWLRAEAELQNFRRRAQRDAEEGRRQAEELVLLELVGLLDDLERAIESAASSGAPESWTQGVALVIQRAREYLNRAGVVAVDPLGQPFDPHFHEALLEVDPPPGTEPGSVVQVVHKGYRRGPRALRAARVVVARHHSESAL